MSSSTPPRIGRLTELGIAAILGEVKGVGSHSRVLVADDASSLWSSYLALQDPPRADTLQAAVDLFAESYSEVPSIRHVSLSWCSSQSDPELLTRAQERGFMVNHCWVMLHPRGMDLVQKGLSVASLRRVSTLEEWTMVHNLQLRVESEFSQGPDLSGFLERRLFRYRKACERSEGAWYGAFVGDELVASLGVFRVGELARLQCVHTLKEWRRQGFASALLRFACNDGSALGSRVVVFAQPHSVASRMYERLGFTLVEHYFQIARWK